jgi:FkbM family methyltransferase
VIWSGQCQATGGGSSLPLDQILYERYFRDVKTGTAIECGANDGLFLSTCKVFEDIGWEIINIEASPVNFEKLVRNRPKSCNRNFALSNKDGDVIIQHYEIDNGGMDKISTESGCVQVRNLKPESICPVRTRRYDEFILKPIDLFVLDVEGHELKVIEGMANTKYWPKVICVEHGHVALDKIEKSLNVYKLDWSDGLNAVFKVL